MKFLVLLLCAVTLGCGTEVPQPAAEVQFVRVLGRQVRKLTYNMRQGVAYADFSGLPRRLRKEAMSSLYYRDEMVRSVSKSLQQRIHELLGSSGNVVTTPTAKTGHDAGMRLGTQTIYKEDQRIRAGTYLRNVYSLPNTASPREVRDEKIKMAILAHEFAAEVALLLRKKQTAQNILLRAAKASESTQGRVRLEITLKGKNNEKIGTLPLNQHNIEEVTEYLYREIHGFERKLPQQAEE